MTSWLGVALLPRADHLRAAIGVQREVGGDRPLTPELRIGGNLPHVTVAQGPFTDSLLPERELAAVAGAAGLPAEIALACRGIIHRPGGWVFLALQRTPVLEKLQAAVLDTLAPHLDREAIAASPHTADLTDAERAAFHRYGYRYTGDAYAPHITLGRTEEEAAREAVRTAPERTVLAGTWVFDRLSLYAMGDSGAHAHTLAELPLDRA